jgi:hypothetical protein
MNGAAPERAERAGYLAALGAALVGVAWFAAHVGLAIVWPTNLDWLLRGDFSAHYLGWAFYRAAPLGLPLGIDPAYPWQVGSSLAFSDSIPVVGVLLRPVEALLPERFQYFGLWLLACFALQGYVGARLVRLFSRDPAVQLAGGALLALAPPLLHRILGPNTGHPSLCAQWIQLGALWLAVAPLEGGRWERRVALALAWILLATGVHPYHLVVVLALSAALAVRLVLVDRVIGPGTAVACVAAFLACAGGGSALFGYVGTPVASRAAGFGLFGADLLALVDPMRWSRLWDGFGLGGGRYEGFAFLGAGALALALVAGAVAVGARDRIAATRWRLALPAVAVAALLALYSLSDRVTVAGSPALTLGFYGWIPWLGGTLRASGRFVWLLHYCVVLASIAAVAIAWRDRPRAAAAVLAGAIAIQVADVRPPEKLEARFTPARSEAWAAARGRYRHVALTPPLLLTGEGSASPGCPVAFGERVYLRSADLALRLGATFNSGYLARVDPAKAAAACAGWSQSLEARALDPETIYVVHPELDGRMRAAGAACGTLDGLLVCVDGGRRDPFAAALRGAAPPAADGLAGEPRR